MLQACRFQFESRRTVSIHRLTALSPATTARASAAAVGFYSTVSDNVSALIQCDHSLIIAAT
jgi:hypothetical protein